MNIHLKTIPHKSQRYDTVGDWRNRNGRLSLVTVSNMRNKDYEFLVGLHEMIEGCLCNEYGISQKSITAFDVAYEKARVKNRKAPCGCKPTSNSEPGNDKHAPYGHCHRFATKIERMVAFMLEVDWKKYGDAVESL